MKTRGSYQLEIDSNERLADSPANLQALRKLFRDGSIINDRWGPGDPGDFDYGSWHILCHLAGGSGVLKTADGLAWCGITHARRQDVYEATVTCHRGGQLVTLPLAGEGAGVVRHATSLGFIEGSSLGHITARGVNDPPNAFNHWPRQAFDQPVDSEADGGVVWEHWSTTRDIRESSRIGTSVLRAYLTLVCVLGGRFVAAVARGRREHEHPRQLAALVQAGVLLRDEATWDIVPDPIPLEVQRLLYEATPEAALNAAGMLFGAGGAPRYFMFQRRIAGWSKTADVQKDLGR